MRFTLVALTALVALALMSMRPNVEIHGTGNRIVIWLHGYQQNASMAPIMDAIVVAPVFRAKADWQNYDMKRLIRWLEKYNLPIEIEGFSRGAYGAAFHAADNPGVFREVRCLAGYYPNFPQIVDPVKFYAGTLDERWKYSTVEYAKSLGKEVHWVDARHHLTEFYGSDITSN